MATQTIFYFHPLTFWEMNPIWRAYFFLGWVEQLKPPTSMTVLVLLLDPQKTKVTSPISTNPDGPRRPKWLSIESALTTRSANLKEMDGSWILIYLDAIFWLQTCGLWMVAPFLFGTWDLGSKTVWNERKGPMTILFFFPGVKRCVLGVFFSTHI